MMTLTLVLLALVIIPFMIIIAMWLLEVISDLLFLVVRILDKMTGYNTDRRITKNRDDDRGFR